MTGDAYQARTERVDLMVAMNDQTYEQDLASVGPGGWLIYDSTWPRNRHLHRDDIVVMGVPANEFGGQEPGSNEEISQFCTSKFDVTFPMYEKVVVKGEGQHPLYAHLTEREGQVSWNFNKFLVSKDGEVLERFESKVAPESDRLIGAIEAALGRS